MMNRMRIAGTAALILMTLVMGATGCAGPASKSPSTQSTKTGTTALRFGPVYPVAKLTDPVVAATVAGDAGSQAEVRSSMSSSTASPAVSAEIRGYLVDWVIRNGSTMTELVVMKDGSIWGFAQHMRPSAAFGAVAPARLTPESPQEAKARVAALAAAQAYVARTSPLFKTAKPVVYGYLVRIHRADGTSTDVWVDPDVGHGRFFYGLELKRAAR